MPALVSPPKLMMSEKQAQGIAPDWLKQIFSQPEALTRSG